MNENESRFKYTVSDMDRMRTAIRRAYPMPMSGHVSNSIEEQRTAIVENMLRSFMVNGTTPEELESLPPHRCGW